MSRRFFVAGNWKCNGSTSSIDNLCSKWRDSTFNGAKYYGKNVQVVIAVPALYAVQTKALLPKSFEVALQNCHVSAGAYSGEIAAEMLSDVSIPWVILGHVDRRTNFHETDDMIADKVRAAMYEGLSVIAVVGENMQDREDGRTMDVIESQLSAIAQNVTDWTKVVIAYDPVWASGSRIGATPQQAQEVHETIRFWLTEHVNSMVAASTRIIYGGSVNSLNAKTIASQPDVDGFLVGRSSLKADFIKIIDSYEG